MGGSFEILGLASLSAAYLNVDPSMSMLFVRLSRISTRFRVEQLISCDFSVVSFPSRLLAELHKALRL